MVRKKAWGQLDAEAKVAAAEQAGIKFDQLLDTQDTWTGSTRYHPPVYRVAVPVDVVRAKLQKTLDLLLKLEPGLMHYRVKATHGGDGYYPYEAVDWDLEGMERAVQFGHDRAVFKKYVERK